MRTPIIFSAGQIKSWDVQTEAKKWSMDSSKAALKAYDKEI